MEASEKIKFLFIQKSWMYFFVKSWNSQISYFIKIMTLANLLKKYTFTW